MSALFSPSGRPNTIEHTRRQEAWERALRNHRPPEFVETRLNDSANGKRPWISTMTPVELGLARSHGIRPLATVSGTCWLHYGYSWTLGHAEGWRTALARMREEAAVMGANAIVDVKMRTLPMEGGGQHGFHRAGHGRSHPKAYPKAADPVIATVPALEFVRLLEAGIVPVGAAIGADYQWLTGYNNVAGRWTVWNQPLVELSNFWEMIRRNAHAELRFDTQRQGNGVLAQIQFGQLIKVDVENSPPRFLGRHIVIGTVVDYAKSAAVPHHIRTVVDMRDDLSPLSNEKPHGHSAYALNDEEGMI